MGLIQQTICHPSDDQQGKNVIYPNRISELADGWVVRNLRQFHNSVVPRETVECFECTETLERVLSLATGELVKIRKTGKRSYIAES